MDKMLKQFFGDAKALRLTPTEKAAVWDHIATVASAKTISLSDTEKAASFDRIAAHMKKHPMPQPATESWFSFLAFHKLVASTMIAVLLIGIGGGGVAYAAQDAVPGDTLYTFKVDVTEPLIDAALSFDPERRAEWERRRIKRRLKEAEYLSSSEAFTPEHRAQLQERLEHRMQKLHKHLERIPEGDRALVRERVDSVIAKHQEFLEKVESGDVSREEVRAFREHMHSVRDRAHKRWGGPPRHHGKKQLHREWPSDEKIQERLDHVRERIHEAETEGRPVPPRAKEHIERIEHRLEQGLPVRLPHDDPDRLKREENRKLPIPKHHERRMEHREERKERIEHRFESDKPRDRARTIPPHHDRLR